MNVLIDNWPYVLIAALVALVLLFVALRPRQRVTLTDSAPIRPHMAVKNADARTMADQPAGVRAAAAPESAGSSDDLLKLKGIGPRLAALLNDHGITRFEQLASLSPDQVGDLDNNLGAFRGRLTRDHVVDQADYLARGDLDGFEQRFGKL